MWPRQSFRVIGIGLMLLGLWMVLSPLWAGEWAIALFAVPVMIAGVTKLVAAFTRGQAENSGWADYGLGVLLVVFGPILFAVPGMTVAEARNILLIYLAGSALVHLVAAIRNRSRPGAAQDFVSAIVATALALLVMRTGPANIPILAGLVVAFVLLSTGWRLAFSVSDGTGAASGEPVDRHLYQKLDLPQNTAFSELYARMRESNPLRSAVRLQWLGYFVLTLFAIHATRMGASLSVSGLVPPLAATLGDLIVAVAVFWLLLVPLQLAWRWVTRGMERQLWLARLDRRQIRGTLGGSVQSLVNLWLDRRYAFDFSMRSARASILDGALLAVGQGIIVAALLVAINSIWGFSWYFNTENWASGIYQAVTGPRVDTWRQAMAESVLAAEGGDPQRAFAVHPAGVEASADFSFLVIGDPGEGDLSQASLKDRYLELARRDDVKFIVISSDVIYPAGEMRDYENNFYMPFKGVGKPIYAIPGNHDWFNALSGFAANLLTPKAAKASIDARAAADHGLTLVDGRARDALIDEAARLRREYGLQTALQAAPYFDGQSDSFALIAIDTGVLKSVDPVQMQWIDGALKRAQGKFVMAITGHPRYAGGVDTATEGSSFLQLFDRLDAGGASVLMAGDTHDFEYYLQRDTGDARQIHHFLNGGGGAYLSIGTALDWPQQPATSEWAYYPSTQALQDKLATETPLWKKPFLWWAQTLRAWPATVEALSGIFDFNNAPFFQSFMEVQVLPSKNEVRFLLQGTNGPLYWRDLDHSLLPARTSPDDEVAFTLPLHP